MIPIVDASSSASSSTVPLSRPAIVGPPEIVVLATALAAASAEVAVHSLLKRATTNVVPSMRNPMKRRKPRNRTNPCVGLLGSLKSGRHRDSLASTSFNDKNPTKLKKYPKFCPMELQIGPLPRLAFDNMVSAHPSTAISCVAMRKYKTKKKLVTPFTFIVDDDVEEDNPNSCSTKLAPPTMRQPASV